MKNTIQVLIIEDNEDDTLLEIDELKNAGFKLDYERVETQQSLMEALNRKNWDCIISDYSMPAFSGLDALKVIQNFGKDIPFILISGAMGEETAVEAMKAGAHDYIMKNDLKRLPPAMERELREAEVRRQKNKAEEDIRNERILLRTLINNLPDCIYIKNTDGCRIVSNSTDLSLLGYKTEEEVLDKTEMILHPDNIGRMKYNDDMSILRTGNAVINREEELIDNNGKQHWMLTSKVPIRNEKRNTCH
ncbi:MAG: response regulator [Bacteroidales bacterium]|nr:response regulator [Bacteroidales bacterium]